jgi:hypothetical protein
MEGVHLLDPSLLPIRKIFVIENLKVEKMVKNLSKVKWNNLKPSQKRLRVLSLNVLTDMRNGKSLTSASKEFGLDKEIVKQHIKSAIIKKRERWVAKKIDRIERCLVINEKGKSRGIIVTNSKDASLIGEYHNAVKKFLETGDKSLLKKFKRRIIKDSKGKKHKLETNPDKLYEISEAREDEEFFEIYEV